MMVASHVDFKAVHFRLNLMKSRRKHELAHTPRPVIEESTNLPITSEKPDMESTNKAKTSDDMFNYNCAILYYTGLFFLNSWMQFPRVMVRDS